MRLLGELEGPELTQEAPGPGGLSRAAGTVCACRRLLTGPRDVPCGGTLASSSTPGPQPGDAPSVAAGPPQLAGHSALCPDSNVAGLLAPEMAYFSTVFKTEAAVLAQDHRGRRGLPTSLSGAQFSAVPAATCRTNETWGPALGPDLGFAVHWVGVGQGLLESSELDCDCPQGSRPTWLWWVRSDLTPTSVQPYLCAAAFLGSFLMAPGPHQSLPQAWGHPTPMVKG